MIDSVKVVRRGKVRRAKLYYLRDRRGKSARIAERTEDRGQPRRGRGEGRRQRGGHGGRQGVKVSFAPSGEASQGNISRKPLRPERPAPFCDGSHKSL